MKKAYYSFMYEATNAVMWLLPHSQTHFSFWWNTSENYRSKRNVA